MESRDWSRPQNAITAANFASPSFEGFRSRLGLKG